MGDWRQGLQLGEAASAQNAERDLASGSCAPDSWGPVVLGRGWTSPSSPETMPGLIGLPSFRCRRKS